MSENLWFSNINLFYLFLDNFSMHEENDPSTEKTKEETQPIEEEQEWKMTLGDELLLREFARQERARKFVAESQKRKKNQKLKNDNSD